MDGGPGQGQARVKVTIKVKAEVKVKVEDLSRGWVGVPQESPPSSWLIKHSPCLQRARTMATECEQVYHHDACRIGPGHSGSHLIGRGKYSEHIEHTVVHITNSLIQGSLVRFTHAAPSSWCRDSEQRISLPEIAAAM